MKTSLNSVTIRGNIGINQSGMTHAGKQWCNFSVAVTESWKDKTNEWKEHTEWFNCKGYGKDAETYAKWDKGDAVHVEGKCRTEKWTDETGAEKDRHVIMVKCAFRLVKDLKKKDHHPGYADQNGNNKYDDFGDDIPF